MPGIVEQHVKEQERLNGQDHMMHRLAKRLDDWQKHKAVDNSPKQKRAAVREICIKALQSLRDETLDRWSGLESMNYREFDNGQLDAIRKWSHTRNQEINQQISSTQKALAAAHARGTAARGM